MITRFYANNFRCLVAFETRFNSFGVLCGPNGSGKSSIFDALTFVRNLATGECLLGGEGENDVTDLDFTNWLGSKVQEFEVEVERDDHRFGYVVHVEQVASHEKPRIVHEHATCDGRQLFERDLQGVRLPKLDGTTSQFPLDWRQAALGSIQAVGDRKEIALLQQTLAGLLILQPNPRAFERESKAEARYPHNDIGNLMSWYRFLYQEQEWSDLLRESLQGVWPDFKAFKLESIGITAKALQLRFENELLFLHQLSDGERMLVALYMLRTALATDAAQTVFIDEPDNFVGLPEIQPWVVSLRELLDEHHQAIIISHHPEVLSSATEEYGIYCWRDNHSSPTRIGPLRLPDGMPAGEALARGWIDG